MQCAVRCVYHAVCGVHVQCAALSVVYTTWCSAWRRGRGTGSEGRGFWTSGGDRSILIRPKTDCTFLTSFNVCNLSKSCLGKSECTADLFQTGIPPLHHATSSRRRRRSVENPCRPDRGYIAVYLARPGAIRLWLSWLCPRCGIPACGRPLLKLSLRSSVRTPSDTWSIFSPFPSQWWPGSGKARPGWSGLGPGARGPAPPACCEEPPSVHTAGRGSGVLCPQLLKLLSQPVLKLELLPADDGEWGAGAAGEVKSENVPLDPRLEFVFFSPACI